MKLLYQDLTPGFLYIFLNSVKLCVNYGEVTVNIWLHADDQGQTDYWPEYCSMLVIRYSLSLRLFESCLLIK